ncbi:unnamed protein product [Calypogeia fissa]
MKKASGRGGPPGRGRVVPQTSKAVPAGQQTPKGALPRDRGDRSAQQGNPPGCAKRSPKGRPKGQQWSSKPREKLVVAGGPANATEQNTWEAEFVLAQLGRTWGRDSRRRWGPENFAGARRALRLSGGKGRVMRFGARSSTAWGNRTQKEGTGCVTRRPEIAHSTAFEGGESNC